MLKSRTWVWGTSRRADGIQLRAWGVESGSWVQVPALPPTSCSTLVKVLTSVSSSAKWGNTFSNSLLLGLNGTRQVERPAQVWRTQSLLRKGQSHCQGWAHSGNTPGRHSRVGAGLLSNPGPALCTGKPLPFSGLDSSPGEGDGNNHYARIPGRIK